MTLNGFDSGTVRNNQIPTEGIRRRKEQLKKEIQEIREKIAQCEIEMSMIQSHSNDDRRQSNAKQLSFGKKQFNENSKEGIRWLLENGLIQNKTEHVAAFLFNETGLSKRSIGDYLGEKDEFQVEVLKHFAHMHNFFSMDIVEALRRYLSTFILPGEAQKIDRIMEAFAQRYYECNSDVFASSDVCFVISFAIIMLNTSLHNKNARLGGPISYEKFFSSLSETINRDQMPEQSIIRSIYENIKQNEFKFPDDGLNSNVPILAEDSTIIKEGWLWKQGGRVRNWKRRWFAITDGYLFYFESRTEIEIPRGVIPLIDVGVREIEEDRTKPCCFEIFSLTGDKVKASKSAAGEVGKWIDGHHSVYRMSASSEDDRKDWIRALRIASQNELPKTR